MRSALRSQQPPAGFSNLREVRYREYFAGLIEQGIAEGSFKPVDAQAAAQVILSLAVGLVLQGVLDPQGADWQKAAEESMKILMNGLA
ncbi:MAG: TetR family transcriptional regulator C-terminal domain-containing protein [Chloroflexi bacterium]|nr:TetR family transcriptional regulator C-terminal domain-containing protein [Chloroflexota bacterium]